MAQKPFRPALPTIHSASNADFSTTGPSVGEKLGDLLWPSKNSLPMYKDKPHGVPQSKRSKAGNQIGLAVVFIIGMLWISGLLPGLPHHGSSRPDATSRPSRVGKAEWAQRKQAVVDAFSLSWDYYAEHAWGMDEFHPIKQTSKNHGCKSQAVEHCPPTGWIIVDALDTAMMMNLTTRVQQARSWISTSLDFSKVDSDMSTFETTIRVLGGLLSAHYLSTNFPDLAPLSEDDVGTKGEDLYIEKAVDLADRLLGAFDTPTGIPLSSCTLSTGHGVKSGADEGAASTAEATTLQLELKYVSKLTGEPLYWTKAEQVMAAVDAPRHEAGLLPIFIQPTDGSFRGQTIRLGSRGDSYYEYLIKQYLQTGSRESVYLEMWEETLQGMKEHLITWGKHSNFTVLAERQHGLHAPLKAKMDHLVCFLPGTIALGVTGGASVKDFEARQGTGLTKKQATDLRLAEELAKTCYGMYFVTPTGLAGEITHFELTSPTRAWNITDPDFEIPKSADMSARPNAQWRKDYDIHRQDTHNLQRPETIESLLYLYRITGDEKYRHWGWNIFQAFLKHTAVHDGQGNVVAYTSIDSVMNKDRHYVTTAAHPPNSNHIQNGHDNMEGFWLAETLKYLYLLFDDNEHAWSNLENIVFNTEAHVLPRFDIGADQKIWRTGWTRKPKGEWQKEHDARKKELAGSIEQKDVTIADP